MKKQDLVQILQGYVGMSPSDVGVTTFAEMQSKLADVILSEMAKEKGSLAEAKQFLRDNWEEGCECPACHQNVKQYKHKINGLTAKSLIDLYVLTLQNPNKPYFHVQDDIDVPLKVGGSFAKMRWWKLIEEMPKDDDSKGRTSGYWRITMRGIAFVKNELTIPEYVKLFNAKHFGFTGKNINIHSSLDSKFNYDELMGR